MENSNPIKNFIKKEPVTSIAFLLALISIFIIKPDAEYAGYIHWSTLSSLLCLMLITSGLRGLGVFDYVGRKLLCKAGTSRNLTIILVGLCFLSAPFITNDVALITFVPFAIDLLIMANLRDYLIRVLTLQTIAAHMGSMISPIGNPHNLYFFGIDDLSALQFMGRMLPYFIASGTLLLLACVLVSRNNVPLTCALNQPRFAEACPDSRNRLIVYGILFLLCISAVLKLVPHIVVLPVVLLAVLVFDRRSFTRVDYYLLLTFSFLFIFVGNIGRIEAIEVFLSSVVNGHELVVGALASQVISNVPASILLSGFSDRYMLLAIATDIGGIGTMIASMANLISFKQYSTLEDAKIGKYIGTFTLINFAFLIVMLAFALIIN